MKKIIYAFMAVVALSMISCNKKGTNEPNAPKQDTTVVSQALKYRVECNELLLQYVDLKLEYIEYPDSNSIKSIKLTGEWESEAYEASKGVFGIRLTAEPKEGITYPDDLADNLFDKDNGGYIYLKYGIRDIYKEGYASEFHYDTFGYADLRGKGEYKDKLTADAIRSELSMKFAYNYEFDGKYISQTPIRTFWDRK